MSDGPSTANRRMIGAMNAQAGRHRATLSAIAVACVLSAPGCGFAVKHPGVTAGIAAGTLGFTTCKLASDNWEACGYVAVRNPADKSDGRWRVDDKRQVIYGKAELPVRDRALAAMKLAGVRP